MQRGSGLLLHITSLPSGFGIGDIGPGAYRFVDFLAAAKQKYWQVLPVTPTEAVNHHSPYSGTSAFAGNILLISPERLLEEGWITAEDIKHAPLFSDQEVVYGEVARFKKDLLACGYKRSKRKLKEHPDYQAFCAVNHSWLDDFALFVVMKEYFEHKAFSYWPDNFRFRDPQTLADFSTAMADELQAVKWQQYIFFSQWAALKAYAAVQKILLIGDIPIYVNDDSADVWANPDLFILDDDLRPKYVAGVPPDYFSQTGQRWGNPIYDWAQMAVTGYAWWLERIRHNTKLYDHVRIDHFRGFAGFWQIPAQEPLAIHGQWQHGPGERFFDAIFKQFHRLPIIAEDLGVITPDVKTLMDRYGFPGMKILLFAFGDDIRTNPYIPENYSENAIVYTGTHDNNTVRGWFDHDASPREKENLCAYLKREVTAEEVAEVLIKLAMNSRAAVSIFPLQDICGLGKSARMNVPGTLVGNWRWRATTELFADAVAQRIGRLTEEFHRS